MWSGRQAETCYLPNFNKLRKCGSFEKVGERKSTLFSGQNLSAHTPHYLYSQVNCIQSSWMQLSRMYDYIHESGQWWWWETWTFAIPCYIHILWQDKKHHRSDVGCSLLQIWLKPDQTALKGFHQIASLKTQTTLLGHPQVIRNSPGVSFECEGKSFWQESFCCFRSWRLQSLV